MTRPLVGRPPSPSIVSFLLPSRFRQSSFPLLSYQNAGALQRYRAAVRVSLLCVCGVVPRIHLISASNTRPKGELQTSLRYLGPCCAP